MGDERRKDGLAGDKAVEAGRGQGKDRVTEVERQISRWEAKLSQTLLSVKGGTELRKGQ